MASIAKRDDGRWRARYRDPDGKEHARHFAKKVDAQKWLDQVTTAIVSGQYVDPVAGKRTLKEYADAWAAAQPHRESTRVKVESSLRMHVLPQLGARPIAALRRSDIQAWVKGRDEVLSAGTIRVVYSLLAAVLRSAVDDRVIPSSPCTRITLPKVQSKRVEPLTTGTVTALASAVPAPYRALIVLAAGTGMRQGECWGLSVDRIDFLRRTVTVDRQLVSLAGKPPTLTDPKSDASARTIPLPQVVVDALAAHLAQFPAVPVPMRVTAGGRDREEPVELLFRSETGAPLNRGTFSSNVWQPAAKAVKLRKGETFHALRHYYASLLIRHGESVKTVQVRLGHASAVETLRTYTHLWPDSEDRTREAVDLVLGVQDHADQVRTEAGF